MSKRTRPWDQQGGREWEPKVKASLSSNGDPNDDHNNNHNDEQQQQQHAQEPSSVPFVDINGVRYWSDRFYLNRTDYNHANDPNNTANNTTNADRVRSLYHADCTCGARRPPPLLDRNELVASLQLKAAIVASFTVNLKWMADAMPTLFGPDATVPTLVLHGHKGLRATTGVQVQQQQQAAAARARDNDSSEDDDEEWSRRPTNVSNHSVHSKNGNMSTSVSKNTTLRLEESTTLEEAWLEKQKQRHVATPLSQHVHLTQILARWLPQPWPSTTPGSSWRQEKKANVLNQRKTKIGVHHPKYLILFETSGAVIVVVSTANLTKPSSTDGSWIQRFEPISSSQTKNKIPLSQRRRDGSDFGAVLANFIQCQSYAAGGGMLPEEFLHQYMNFSSLDDLVQNYQWERAQVHLIATVPGEYEGRTYGKHLERDSTGSEKRTRFLYARQRVADILSRLSPKKKDGKGNSSSTAWFPEQLLTDTDRLIVQPTSFGGNWTRTELACVVKSYLGLDNNGKAGTDEQKLVERMDIVWPTKRLVDTIAQCLGMGPKRQSPTSVTADIQRDSMHTGDGDSSGGTFMFLSSRAFNSIELSCLSQMVQFEPSIPEQQPSALMPHFKSFARLFDGNEKSLRKKYGVQKSEEIFSWFVLTSACLSHGAQGYASKNLALVDDMLSYANFELGVMFCSRLQGDESMDRLYCWKPAQCSCGGHTTGHTTATLIHLPLPYCSRGRRYQLDADEAEFAETPYMHELDSGSDAVGHMLLTPLGAARAAARTAAADKL